MFSPCTDQRYKDISHACLGNCYDCTYKKVKEERDELKRENEALKVRIESELEPRLKQERRSYDAFVINAERSEVNDAE